jgi:hypothetical protein
MSLVLQLGSNVSGSRCLLIFRKDSGGDRFVVRSKSLLDCLRETSRKTSLPAFERR